MDRRTELVSAASDYVSAHGLIGLSLRPLAAAIGTSDRMLLYHFDSKDDLVAAVLEHSARASLTELTRLEPRADVHAAVLQLWQALRGRLAADYRVYVEASAMGLLGREPYRGVIRAGNRDWRRALERYFAASGAAPTSAGRVTTLVDAALMGLFVDLPLADDPGLVERSVTDLADAAVALSGAE